MVRWVRGLSAVITGICWFILFPGSHPGIATTAGMVNLIWATEEKWPVRIRPFFRSSVLVLNAVLLAYVILQGGAPMSALFPAGTSLLAWNVGLFLQRWTDPPVIVQFQYLRRIGALLAFGLLMGISASALRGRVALPFVVAFLLMLATAILWLRTVSRTVKNKNR